MPAVYGPYTFRKIKFPVQTVILRHIDNPLARRAF